MINKFTNSGFKDQEYTVTLSGLDLFTSDNVNGVGKSAVLEGFKLALLGEIPGKAKTLDDLLLFSSQKKMELEVVGDTLSGCVAINRQFLREATKSEKRTVGINQVFWKFEKGDRWIRDHLGPVSVSFDPFEFLNLSDGKKRQWILSHSPESQMLTHDNLYAALVARVIEVWFGGGLLRSLLQGKRANLLSSLSLPKEELMSAFRCQDEARFLQVKELLDQVFGVWDDSSTAEANIAAILVQLKSESQRLKNLVNEKSKPISEADQGLSDKTKTLLENDFVDLDSTINAARKNLRAIEETLQNLRGRLKKRTDYQRREKAMEDRLQRLKNKIALLTGEFTKVDADLHKVEILRLQGNLSDPAVLINQVDALNKKLCDLTETYREREKLNLSEALKNKRRQLATMESSGFHCPVDATIQCTTNMNPYRDLLAGQVEELHSREKIEQVWLKETAGEIDKYSHLVKEKQGKLKEALQSNQQLQKNIDYLKDLITAKEKILADARGRLKAHKQELNTLMAERKALSSEDATNSNALEHQMAVVEKDKREQAGFLEDLIREQGRRDMLQESSREKKKTEEKLETVKLLLRLLGPKGIQGEFALKVSESLENEVNDCLRHIEAEYDFAMDLTGKKLSMGWASRGKLIPLTTINSAHFVLFIVPFLTAVINRLARVREKAGLPTLRALCIEAESMTPDNLVRLLKGLTAIKNKGLLDNVLVAHYHSLRDPEKLSGFKEHILEDSQTAEKNSPLASGPFLGSQTAPVV